VLHGYVDGHIMTASGQGLEAVLRVAFVR